MNDQKKITAPFLQPRSLSRGPGGQGEPNKLSSPWAMKASTRISVCAAFSNALRSFASELQPP